MSLVLGLEHSCPWPRECLSSERLSLASDFFCVLGLGLEPCVLDSTSVADTCNTAAMKISTAKTEVLHLSRIPDQCVLQVNGATLQQVEKFKYVGVAFTSDGGQDEELDTRIGKASAVMRALHYSVVMKRELWKKVKLSVFKVIFVPILTYGHESWVMTKRMRSIVQASEMKFFAKNRRSYNV